MERFIAVSSFFLLFMNIDGFNWLLSADGQALLAELCADSRVSDATFLQHITRLRKTYPVDGATAALETAILRRAARAKFPRADALYFTREALEQATPQRVAAYRARPFAGCTKVADLACSIGGDALALAEFTRVLAVDRDPLRLAMLRENAHALGVSERVELCEADLTTLDCADCDGLFFDPARRADGKRIWDVERYSPPLSTIHRWRDQVPLRAAKVAPGIPDEQVPPDCSVEFISLDGELREATLWWDERQAAGIGDRERGAEAAGWARVATLLSTHSDAIHRIGVDPTTPPAPVESPHRYLYEPDPAVIRAHAVADLALRLDAAQFDADIAFLTSDVWHDTPFARVWEIELVLPFNLKALRRVLQERDVGTLTVKKRGSPITPEQLTRQLHLKGRNHQIVVLTQVADAPTVLLCREPRITG